MPSRMSRRDGIGQRLVVNTHRRRRPISRQAEFVGSLVWHSSVMTHGGRDGQGEYGAVGVRSSLNRGPGTFSQLVARCVARIVLEAIVRRLPILEWVNRQDERVYGLFAGIVHRRLHGNYAAAFHVQRDLTDRKIAVYGDGAAKVRATVSLEPVTGRQPHLDLGEL